MVVLRAAAGVNFSISIRFTLSFAYPPNPCGFYLVVCLSRPLVSSVVLAPSLACLSLRGASANLAELLPEHFAF